MASPFFYDVNIHMKRLEAKHRIPGYETVTMPLEDIVPASTYDQIPDEAKLRPEIEKGELLEPLVLFDTDQRYWQTTHEKLYRKSNPEMPKTAPEKDGRVLIVWKGRQRYQLAKELGYTHVDCVLEKELHRIVAMTMVEKK